MAKRVFITGASSGFGKSAAIELAKRGHTVFATMRGVDGKNSEAAQALRDAAKKDNLALHVLELDVTSDASAQQAVAQAIAQANGIDVLINNAGIGVMGIQESVTTEQAQQLFDVNVLGILRMNRAVLPHMRQQRNGLIIYLSSALGRIILPFGGLYTASKFAVEALAEAASYELKPLGIDSLIIQPGAYGTSFSANMVMGNDAERLQTYGPVKENLEKFLANFSAREPGNPQEVVDAIVAAVENMGTEQALRLPVGADMKQPVETLNQTAQAVQQQLLAAFGM
ncbi:MAG: SDR family oxidoreductase [Chloroflexales bacterium]|nr:SDR family oxidoreductase [Chloroflexales bacterium]